MMNKSFQSCDDVHNIAVHCVVLREGLIVYGNVVEFVLTICRALAMPLAELRGSHVDKHTIIPLVTAASQSMYISQLLSLALPSGPSYKAHK